MKLYAVLDKKSHTLASFHVEKNDAMASRGFADAVNQPNSALGRYADDFDLVVLAEVSEECDVSEIVVPSAGRYEVLLTAAQVVALSAKSGGLSLVSEA